MAQEPLYRRLANHLVQEVVSGRFRTGDRLLPEAQLASALNVSRSTLREALGILERERFIQRIHGIGSFITTRPEVSVGGIESLESLTETIRRSGHVAQDAVTAVSLEEVGDEIARSLDLGTDRRTILIRSVRLADGAPVVYCEDFLGPNVTRNLDVDFVKGNRPKHESLLGFLETDAGVTLSYAVLVLHGEAADEELARTLHVERGKPLLRLAGPVYDTMHRPLYYAVGHFLTSRYEFTLVRRKPVPQQGDAELRERDWRTSQITPGTQAKSRESQEVSE